MTNINGPAHILSAVRREKRTLQSLPASRRLANNDEGRHVQRRLMEYGGVGSLSLLLDGQFARYRAYCRNEVQIERSLIGADRVVKNISGHPGCALEVASQLSLIGLTVSSLFGNHSKAAALRLVASLRSDWCRQFIIKLADESICRHRRSPRNL